MITAENARALTQQSELQKKAQNVADEICRLIQMKAQDGGFTITYSFGSLDHDASRSIPDEVADVVKYSLIGAGYRVRSLTQAKIEITW